MNTQRLVTVSLFLLQIGFPFLCAHAQGTAFTYQGRLSDGSSPANGTYDIKFTIYDSETAPGNIVGGPFTNSLTAVTDGGFTVVLDFGAGPFSGADRWLEIGARTNGASGFTTLTPRQKFTASPYAITAGNLTGPVPNSGIAGTYSSQVTFNNSTNSFTGNGSGLLNVNAATLNGFGYCALPCYWNLSGNSGTSPGTSFVGTTDNEPLTLKVNNTIVLRFAPGATLPNVVGGLAALRPSVVASNASGVVIAGGNAPSGSFTGFGSGDFMAAFDDDGTIGGGFGNKVGSDNGDPTDAAFATVGGGIFNIASSFAATVGGGAANTAAGSVAVVAGGNGNQASGKGSSIGGGFGNLGTGDYETLGGGYQNTNSGLYGSVGGGFENLLNGNYATLGGGYTNSASADYSTVGGGIANSAMGNYGTISGGSHNTVGAGWATVAGGLNNIADGAFSFAAGRLAQAMHQGAFVWADSQNAPFASTTNDQFSVRAQGGVLLSANTSMFFGTQTRQMINLWGSQYGVGVQNLTTYFRTDDASPSNGFSWFKGGVHNDGQNNPGGGVELMRLDSTGLTVKSITITGGADLAEPFEVANVMGDEAEGSVVVIDEDHPGRLKISNQAYDTRVAGVLSGANGVSPGIRMRQLGAAEGTKNVALTGRVYVRADSSNGSIKPGDLLTTSDRPGHAMRVKDSARAQGAILGKAMTGLSGDSGMVLVLVTLQ